MKEKSDQEKRHSERRVDNSDITVFINNDIYMASIVDISESGIRFVTNAPQEVRIQIQEDDRMVEYDAQLVWAKLNDNGTMEYGLKRSSTKNS